MGQKDPDSEDSVTAKSRSIRRGFARAAIVAGLAAGGNVTAARPAAHAVTASLARPAGRTT